MKISVLVAQFPISFNINENLEYIMSVLEKSKEDDLVILPEGALSGYSDDVNFLKNINVKELKNAMKLLKDEVAKKRVHLVFGSCVFENDTWCNAAIGYSYNNPDFIYKKLNLAFHERGYFKEGDKLEVYPIKIGEKTINLGIQLCREIRFPEQWRWLAKHKADIFIYLTNAVQGKGISVWRSHLVSRAAENQRFLISANNAHVNQHCPTMIISPSGEILKECVNDQFYYFREEIDLNETSDWYISQCRDDIGLG
ncbi:carbon-nitrogen hydrolase family protein [Clostridium senegalense]